MYGLNPLLGIQENIDAAKTKAKEALMAGIEEKLLVMMLEDIQKKMPDVNELAKFRAEKLIKDKEAADREAIRKKRHAASIALKDWIDKQPNPLRRTDKSFSRELQKNAPAYLLDPLDDPARVIYDYIRKKYG